MPIPKPHKDETKDEFISRCMETDSMKEYPQDQRLAVCYSNWRNKQRN